MITDRICQKEVSGYLKIAAWLWFTFPATSILRTSAYVLTMTALFFQLSFAADTDTSIPGKKKILLIKAPQGRQQGTVVINNRSRLFLNNKNIRQGINTNKKTVKALPENNREFLNQGLVDLSGQGAFNNNGVVPFKY